MSTPESTPTHLPWASNPMPESTLTVYQSRLYLQSGTLDSDSGLRADLIVDPYCPGKEWLDPELGGEGGQQLTQVLLGPLLAVHKNNVYIKYIL